jgi:hypothetical protein
MSPSANLLLQDVEYKVERTRFGVWRRYLYENGQLFQEFRSHAQVGELPWVHYTYGRSPETGRRVVAKGIVAIGRMSVGFLAIGQAALGVIAIGQAAFGFLLGLGQAAGGAIAVGQLAVGVAFGLGQLATGYAVIAQFGWGKYVLAQLGLGQHVWDVRGAAEEARRFFSWLIPQ